jgi:cytochrome d ubiquinol oxidase subunit I
MNWSEYSRFVGDIFGAPLALEALIAFFLESTFLGMWIFGWDRLSKGLHLATIWLGSVGTVLSSIFIIAANAWMQNPVGAHYNSTAGRAELSSLGAVLKNPVFLTQWPHTIAASFVTAGAFMAAVAAYRLIKVHKENPDKASDHVAYKKGVKFGAWVLIVAGVCSVVTGDLLGKDMVQTQPTKLAAAEDLSASDVNSAGKAGYALFPGVPMFTGLLNWLYGVDNLSGLTIDAIKSTECGSGSCTFMQADSSGTLTAPSSDINALQNGVASSVGTLTDYNGNTMITSDTLFPSIPVTFWTMRLMIGFGLLAVIGGIWLLIAFRGDRVPKPRPVWTVLLAILPLLPLLANSFGWIFTEMGRQPWIVNGVLPTAAAVSPSVPVPAVWFSMVVYTLLYGVLAVVEVRLLLKSIREGLPDDVQVSVKAEGEELSFAY